VENLRHIDITWHHDARDDPYRLVSETGADGFEKRKLEFFHGRQVSYASELTASDTTMLSVGKILALEDLIARAEFSGEAITRGQFELLWNQYVPDDT
jgi:hypothetical protein